jgi:hypothetical protein
VLDSGLPEEKWGSELSDSEFSQLCDAIGAFAEHHPVEGEAWCRYAGLLNTYGNATVEGERYLCQSHYDACTPDLVVLGTFCDSPIARERADCDVTVEQIETCITDGLTHFAATLSALPACQDIDLDYVHDYQTNILSSLTNPEGCAAIRYSCPALWVASGTRGGISEDEPVP